jgi:hypothetical protein
MLLRSVRGQMAFEFLALSFGIWVADFIGCIRDHPHNP